MTTIQCTGALASFFKQGTNFFQKVKLFGLLHPKLFSVITPVGVFKSLELNQHKSRQLRELSALLPRVPTNVEWDKPRAIRIIATKALPFRPSNSTHYFMGGLPALMQATMKLEKLGSNSSDTVIYANDGVIPKTLQSGHQGHVHPSEWASEDCRTLNLFKTMLRELSVIKKSDPADLANYSYLHFPLSLKTAMENPTGLFNLYGGFFKQRILHNLTAHNGVSKQDRWLCECVRKSLAYHKELSDKIVAETGHPTFTQGFRVYWSPNLTAMKKKQEVWEELKIKTEFMTKEEIAHTTLLRIDKELNVLKIYGDGKFYPETPQRILDYLKRHYLNFVHHEATLSELHIHEETRQPFQVVELKKDGSSETLPIKTFFGSPGHNEVFHEPPGTKNIERLWNEVPVSGISSLWQCTIPKEELVKRMARSQTVSDSDIEEYLTTIVASANLSNLHTTSWDGQVQKDKVVLFVRASQGGNFNATVAEKDDLVNMRNNLNEYFVGDWELISVGTCTRKTDVTNVPEFVDGFLHGMSGIGYSFSATPLEDLNQGQKNGVTLFR